MSDKEYDCLTCPYPRYRSANLIYCDVCIQRILDQYQERMNHSEAAGSEIENGPPILPQTRNESAR